LLALAAAALALAQSATATATAPALDYFALGDSIASGHGLLDAGGTCRRSERAYPRTVLADLRDRHGRVRFTMLACSGAVASGGPAGLRSLARQVDAVLAHLSKRPTLVTITVGINDFAWSDVIATYLRLRDPDETLFEAWVEATAERAAEGLGVQVDRLLRHRKVAVVLTDYPNPVNPESVLFAGPLPCADVAACYGRTEFVVHELNRALRMLARRRVRVATVHEAFHGHEAPAPSCGEAPPSISDTWFQYPEDPESNSFPPLPSFVSEEWRGDCFHPNALGAATIAEAVDVAARALGR
jgi:lysophospholipase L1-like esterase